MPECARTSETLYLNFVPDFQASLIINELDLKGFIQ